MFLCGTTTIDYKFGCLISLKFIHMTFLSGFNHVGYKRRPHPLRHYNDKHEQVRFRLNAMDFKIPVLSISFLFLAFYIEVEVIYEFCLNAPSILNLITWSLVWCMISSASKALAWFHWSNSSMRSVPMSTRDVKKRSRKTWYSLTQESFFWLYVQGLILTQSFHLNLLIILIGTCE